MKKQPPKWMLPVLATFTAALFGSGFPTLKTAINHLGSNDTTLLFAFAGVRFTLAGLILGLFCKNKAEEYRKSPKLMLWGVAFFQIGLQYALFYWGLAMTPSLITAIIYTTGSFTWVLMAPVFHRTEWPSLQRLLILAAGFLGVFIVLWKPGGAGEVTILGAVLLQAGVISATSAVLVVRPLSKYTNSMFMTAFALVGGGLMLLVLGAPALGMLFERLDLFLVLLTCHLMLISALGFTLWYYLVGLYDVNTMSAYRYLIPVFGVIGSAIIIPGESLGITIFFGGGILALSLWANERLNRGAMRRDA